MSKLLATLFTVSALTVSADNLLQINGQLTDKLPGWKFKPSKPKDGMTYNEFEGYYPDKGGKLISQRLKIEGNNYYRLRFDAQAPERAYQGADFYDQSGNLLPDNYDVIYAGDKRGYDRIIFAMSKVDSMEVFFQSTTGIQAWNLTVEKVSWQEAAEYCDRVYRELPPLNFTAPKDSMKLLPRTAEALRSGKPWHVVMLGDSIVQDTFHSQFHSLLKREFPNSNLRFTISMRGGTGCWYYCRADYFKKYVFDEKPDLLIIGGISNYRKGYSPTGTEAMEVVAQTAREYFGCEVLILSAALSLDTRQADKNAPDADLPVQSWSYDNDGHLKNSMDKSGLENMTERNKFAFWDMATPTYTWLHASGKPFEFFSRDKVHSGEKGKQIIGRTMIEYFKTAK